MAKSYPATVPEAYTKHPDLEDAYRSGWGHGHGIACHNVPSIGDRIDRSVDFDGLGDTVTADNIRRYHQLLCFAGADNSRQYSPFEFMAHEFNDHPSEHDEREEGDDTPTSEEMWEAFEEGTSDAIFADLAEYDDESYGIEPDQDEDEGPTYGDRLADWKYAVANDDTQLGFADWLTHQKEAEA